MYGMLYIASAQSQHHTAFVSNVKAIRPSVFNQMRITLKK